MRKPVMSEMLPKSGSPFSHGFKAANLVFTSGQVGVDPENGEVADGVEEQTRQALENVEAVLTAAGCSKKDVVKATVFLADIRDYSAMNDVYGSFFDEPYPARSCVEAKLASPEYKVEIEAIASK